MIRKERVLYIELFNKLIPDYSKEVEKSCYNKTVISHKKTETNNWNNKRFVEDYSAECYRIYSLLEQNEELIEKLNDEEFRKNISMFSTNELVKDLHKEEKEEIDIRKNVVIEQKISTRYRCKKCGTNKTTLEEYQGNALDEAAKISIKCISCGYVWRR